MSLLVGGNLGAEGTCDPESYKGKAAHTQLRRRPSRCGALAYALGLAWPHRAHAGPAKRCERCTTRTAVAHCAPAAAKLTVILIMSASSAAALAPVNTVVVARDAAGRAPVTASASAHGFYRRRLLSGDYGWTTYEIYTSADDVFSVFGIDLDGDGDVDVLSASGNDDTIAWCVTVFVRTVRIAPLLTSLPDLQV